MASHCRVRYKWKPNLNEERSPRTCFEKCERDVNPVRPEPVAAEQELDGRLELAGQEENLSKTIKIRNYVMTN